MADADVVDADDVPDAAQMQYQDLLAWDVEVNIPDPGQVCLCSELNYFVNFYFILDVLIDMRRRTNSIQLNTNSINIKTYIHVYRIT